MMISKGCSEKTIAKQNLITKVQTGMLADGLRFRK